MLLKTTRRFTEYLDGKDIKYTAKENEGKSDWVSVKYSAENMESINLSFFFDQDCQSFALRVFSIAKVPQNKIPAVLSVCNELANDYRWVRFYVDNDFPVIPPNLPEEVYQLLDYGAIGRKARMEEGGVLTSGGYVVQHSDLDVSYSRSQRPQQMEATQ